MIMNKNDIIEISDLLDKKLEPTQQELKEHGKWLRLPGKILRTLRKTQDIMLYMLDREQMNQRK